MYIQSQKQLKTFQIFKNEIKIWRMTNLYSCKDLFTYSFSLGEKTKSCSEWPHWLAVILWCFIRLQEDSVK